MPECDNPITVGAPPDPQRMTVSRFKIIENGLKCRCPNCGLPTLFRSDSRFKVNETCPNCDLRIENGDGAFLGPFAINYGVTAFGVIIPVIVLYATGRIGARVALPACFAGALLVPLLLYRVSWGWWLMLYYFFLPANLPANRMGREEDDR